MTRNSLHDFWHALRGLELRRLPPVLRRCFTAAFRLLVLRVVRRLLPDCDRAPHWCRVLRAGTSQPPDNVEWIATTLGDLSPVADGEVDLVFAGQVVEHLWADELAGFLIEAHRVLRPGGAIAIDSTNRRVTFGVDWVYPQHTLELTVTELIKLLELAGFTNVDVRGIWLCHAADTHRFLPLEIDGGGTDWPWDRRVRTTADRPEDSLIWWAEATRRDARVDADAIRARVGGDSSSSAPQYLRRLRNEVGTVFDHAGELFVRAAKGESGYLVRGPSVAMPPGRWRAHFVVGVATGFRIRLFRRPKRSRR